MGAILGRTTSFQGRDCSCWSVDGEVAGIYLQHEKEQTENTAATASILDSKEVLLVRKEKKFLFQSREHDCSSEDGEAAVIADELQKTKRLEVEVEGKQMVRKIVFSVRTLQYDG